MSINPMQHNHGKHIVIDYHCVLKWVADGDLVIRYIPTKLQVVDIFVKVFSSKQFLLHKSNLSIHPLVQIEGA